MYIYEKNFQLIFFLDKAITIAIIRNTNVAFVVENKLPELFIGKISIKKSIKKGLSTNFDSSLILKK